MHFGDTNILKFLIRTDTPGVSSERGFLVPPCIPDGSAVKIDARLNVTMLRPSVGENVNKGRVIVCEKLDRDLDTDLFLSDDWPFWNCSRNGKIRYREPRLNGETGNLRLDSLTFI